MPTDHNLKATLLQAEAGTAYFLAGPALALISEEGRRLLFSRTIFWLPPTLPIAGALLVARLAFWKGISTRVKLYRRGGAGPGAGGLAHGRANVANFHTTGGATSPAYPT